MDLVILVLSVVWDLYWAFVGFIGLLSALVRLGLGCAGSICGLVMLDFNWLCWDYIGPGLSDWVLLVVLVVWD